MSSRRVWGASVAAIVVACTTNTTGGQGGRAGGAACDYDSECESKTCTGDKGAAPPSGSTSSGSSGEGEEVGPGGASVQPLGTCANPTTNGSGTSSSGASGNPGGGGNATAGASRARS